MSFSLKCRTDRLIAKHPFPGIGGEAASDKGCDFHFTSHNYSHHWKHLEPMRNTKALKKVKVCAIFPIYNKVHRNYKNTQSVNNPLTSLCCWTEMQLYIFQKCISLILFPKKSFVSSYFILERGGNRSTGGKPTHT